MSSFNKTSAQELQKLLAEKRKALQSFHFNLSGSKTKNVKEGKGIKKEIAQILTALNTRNA